MTKDDKKVIDLQNHETLAKWWTMINCSEIVDELPNTKEVNVTFDKPIAQWTKEETKAFKESRSLSIMSYIESIIGRKETSRYWNKDRMNNEEFEDFWLGTYEGDEEAKRHHEIKSFKKLATNANIPHDLIDWTRLSKDILEDLCELDERNS